jgi:hypothetical protein
MKGPPKNASAVFFGVRWQRAKSGDIAFDRGKHVRPSKRRRRASHAAAALKNKPRLSAVSNAPLLTAITRAGAGLRGMGVLAHEFDTIYE